MSKLIFTVTLTMLVLMQLGCSKSDDSTPTTSTSQSSNQSAEETIRNNVPMFVDMLRKQGFKAQDTKVVELDFDIADKSVDKANALAESLNQLGYEAEVLYSDTKMTQPIVTAKTTPIAVNQEALSKLVDDMIALAKKHGSSLTGFAIPTDKITF